jgi:hypothetical protein
MVTPIKFPREQLPFGKRNFLRGATSLRRNGFFLENNFLKEKRISFNEQLPQKRRDFLDFLKEKWTKLP